jgi:hypothetical protein
MGGMGIGGAVNIGGNMALGKNNLLSVGAITATGIMRISVRHSLFFSFSYLRR